MFFSVILPRYVSKKLKISIFDEDSVNFFNDIIDQRLKMKSTQATIRNDMVDLFSETMMGNADEDNKRDVVQDLDNSELYFRGYVLTNLGLGRNQKGACNGSHLNGFWWFWCR